MRRLLAHLCIWGAALGALGFTASSSAADLSAAEAKGVRAVIEAQLAAFAADDAPRAFSFAAPKLRELFGDAGTFLEIVRAQYPVVYRHATVAFLKPERTNGEVTQAVHFTDAGGTLWIAVYLMERQGDGSWRISACQTAEAKGQVA